VLREAARESSLDIKQEITAAATLGLAGQRISINEFAERFNLSDAARLAISKKLKSPRLGDEKFKFDANEFKSIISYKSVELSNGALLTAPADKFGDVFRQEFVDQLNKEVQFSTKGRVVNEKLKAAP